MFEMSSEFMLSNVYLWGAVSLKVIVMQFTNVATYVLLQQDSVRAYSLPYLCHLREIYFHAVCGLIWIL